MVQTTEIAWFSDVVVSALKAEIGILIAKFASLVMQDTAVFDWSVALQTKARER